MNLPREETCWFQARSKPLTVGPLRLQWSWPRAHFPLSVLFAPFLATFTTVSDDNFEGPRRCTGGQAALAIGSHRTNQQHFDERYKSLPDASCHHAPVCLLQGCLYKAGRHLETAATFILAKQESTPPRFISREAIVHF